LCRPTEKKSKSPYVNVRIAELTGKTVQYALEEYKYNDKNGKECKYTYGDLKYDINCAYLQDPRGPDACVSDWTPKIASSGPRENKPRKRKPKPSIEFDHEEEAYVGGGGGSHKAGGGSSARRPPQTANTNQPDLPPGTRVEVEFEDDLVGKCWFDGVVDSQNSTGTVVHFDDGDIQDLDLNVVLYGVLHKMGDRLV
jgi:hypothetical protein